MSGRGTVWLCAATKLRPLLTTHKADNDLIMSKTPHTSPWIRRIIAGIICTFAALAFAFGVNTAASAKVPPFENGFVLHGATGTSSPAHHDGLGYKLHVFGFDY